MKTQLISLRGIGAGLGLAMACVLVPGSLRAQTPTVNDFSTDVESYTTAAKVGVTPTVTYNVTYPTPVKDVVNRTDTSGGDPNGTSDDSFTAKVNLSVDFKMVAADYVASTNPVTYKPVWVQYRVNGGGWVDVFKGIHSQITNGKVVKNISIKPNDKVELQFNGAKVTSPSSSNDWNGWRTGTTKYSSTKVVMSLVKGDKVPTYAPYLSANGTGSYLKPYLDPTGKYMANLGTRDIMYTAELTNTDPKSSGFDMQDAILLVTVR